MKSRMTPATLLSTASLIMLTLALARPAYAGTPVVQAAALQAAGAQDRGIVGSAAALHPAVTLRPINVPTPLPVLPSGSVNAPGTYDLQATASAVTVKWYDGSTNELGFKVFRRDLSGSWRVVDQVASLDVRGTGANYSWVDTSTDLSGQCYMIAAYNSTSAGSTPEECTVRPDPSRFPLLVPGYAPQWSGLSTTNDGTGTLVNVNNEQNLEHANQTFGVDLAYGNTSLWRIEAQGGPHLMKGEAVALKVWGGGWLAYGNETFGVDLQLSSTPVYEWYVIGLRNDPSDRSWAGTDITDGGTFALWNSSARAFLIAGYQTWGVSLNWSNKVGVSPSPTPNPAQHGVRTEYVFNCATDQQPVDVWIEDQTTGSGFADQGTVASQYGPDGCPGFGSVPLRFNPISGHHYVLVAVDSTLDGCAGDDPTQGACQAMFTQFTGDANGYTRTDTVNGGTVISP